MATLRELKAEANALFQAGEWVKALKIYRRLVGYEPIDFDSRLKIGRILIKLDDPESARRVLKSVAIYSMKAGHPLRGVVSAKLLSQLDAAGGGGLMEMMAALYSVDSDRMRRSGAARVSPPELDRPAPEESSPDPGLAEVVSSATERAANIERFVNFPEFLPEVPLFSDLSEEAFRRCMETMRVHSLGHGRVIVREGETGESFFIIAGGEVRIFRRDSFGRDIDLARLGEGMIFGEMALVSATPRTASAQVVGEADLLEVPREGLAAVARELDVVAVALSKFTRERLLRNLLATSPLFRPFHAQQRLQLIRHFTGHDVAAGTKVIAEGEEGRGLFLILNGECDVTKIDGDDTVLLATLKAGDVFGEISLLRQQPTTATVTAATSSTILFLPREIFQELIKAVPAVREYFEKLSEDRLQENQLVLSDEEVIEIDADDAVMI